MIKNGIQNSIAFTDKGPRKGWRTPLNIINDSEQRDEEKEGFRGPFASERGDEPRSGIPNGSTYLYTYFGARYMDHELMTMWLSVDPMADKYPSISPYAYCAWNPVKLVDPDGNEFFITGGDGVKYYLTISKDRSLRWVSRDGQSYNIEDNPWVSKLTTAITTLMGKSKTAENVITTLAKDPNHECELREGFRNEIDPSGKGEWIKWTGEVSRGNTLYLSEDGEYFYKPTEKNSPAYIGLIHEMAHAADAWYGYTKDPNGVWEVFQPQKGDNAINILNMEKYAVWVENRVRHEMGLPRRLYYYFNVFVKPNAEGKSRSVCTMLRRENDP